jgi:hypothetical protein
LIAPGTSDSAVVDTVHVEPYCELAIGVQGTGTANGISAVVAANGPFDARSVILTVLTNSSRPS